MPQGCKLRALDVVHTSDVPLCLISGPVLSVSADDVATKEAFHRILDRKDQEPPNDDGNSVPEWQKSTLQLHYGMLLKIDYEPNNSSTATELLVYPAITHNSWFSDSMVTPSRSSSPNNNESTLIHTQPSIEYNRVRLYALPLDSRRLGELSATEVEPLAASAALGDEGARPFPLATVSSEPQQAPRKRRKLSDVIEEASYQRRKFKGRGGESVSRLMAGAGMQRPGKPVDSSASQQEKPIPEQQSINDPPPDTIATSDSDNAILGQNKTALTRVVLAGMRMYGVQQAKKHSTSNSDPDRDTEEYKTIYHQTFKAASFAFRSHFALRPVAQESMREVVDRLLSIFCVDPLPSSSAAPQDVFDQPSSNGEAVTIETPSSRRQIVPP